MLPSGGSRIMRETYKVDRAIIMAAGIGQRMQPLTFKTPKPLIKVNGVSMIDTVVKGLHYNGIKEIYVVVGHLKEQFYEWVKKYNGITIIENPYYNTCNNISSLYVARDYLKNCMILDGDQMIYNPDILNPCFIHSGYSAIWCDGYTDEWLMKEKNGIVESCSRTGGLQGWQLYSISRWNESDGTKLKNQIEYEFVRGNRQIYWDDVPMFCYFDEYTLGIQIMQKSDVVEIDSLAELADIDQSYRLYINTNVKMEDGSNERQT